MNFHMKKTQIDGKKAKPVFQFNLKSPHPYWLLTKVP